MGKKDNLSQTHLDRLEEEVKAELKEKAEASRDKLWPKVKGIMSDVVDGWTKLGLPVGVSLEQSKLIEEMYFRMRYGTREKKITAGKDNAWLRATEIDKDNWSEQWMNTSVGVSFTSGMDILEHLLVRYLPEQMKDQKNAVRIRGYFMEELDLMPHLA